MSEVTFYQDSVVLITNARAVLGAKTYAMAGITSVTTGVIPANRRIGIAIACFGLSAASCGCCPIGLSMTGAKDTGGFIVLGIGLGLLGMLGIAAGIVLALITKPTYVVRIGSASGEANALSSKDAGYIQKIVNAMNEAIVKRG